MNEPDIPPLDDDVRALVRRVARVDPAPADARGRVLEGVERIVGLAAGGGGGGHAGSPPGDGVASFGPRVGLARRLVPLAASFALGGGVVAVALRGAPAAPRSAEPPRIVYVDRFPATPPGVERTADPPEPAAPTVPLAPTLAGAHEPFPQTSRSNVPSRALAPPSPSRDQLTAERQLLDLARGALEREEPEAALEATARHETKYPNGALVQEREAMAIRALVLLGRMGEAHARADRFRLRFPQSLLLPTIESAVGTAPPP